VTWAVFRDRRTGRPFTFLDTHFDHASQNAREKSAAQVLAFVESRENQQPLLLVGDFNAAARGNLVYDLLVGEDRFTDTFLTASAPGEEIDTFHGFTGKPEGRGRIDWILHRGPVDSLSSRVVTFQRDGQFPSDHFPVMAEVRFR